LAPISNRTAQSLAIVVNAFDIRDMLLLVFHGIGQAEFAYRGLVLGSSQFTLIPPLPLKQRLI